MGASAKKKHKPAKKGLRAGWRMAAFAGPCAVAGVAVGALALFGLQGDEAGASWRQDGIERSRVLELLSCWSADKPCSNDEPHCGVVSGPSEVMAALSNALVGNDMGKRAFAFVDSDALTDTGWLTASDEVWLLRRVPRATKLSSNMTTAEAVDRSLLVLDVECGGHWSRLSPRLEALRAVVSKLDAGLADAAIGPGSPVADVTVERWRRELGTVGADIDARGVWTRETALAIDHDTVARGDTALLRAARKCDARGVRALISLGADAATVFDRRGMRALDVALSCDSRTLFGTAKEIVDGCGSACVDYAAAASPADGLAPLHRVLTRWASSFFATRPRPNPWNALASIMLAAGCDPLARTKTAGAETPLHIAVAKRNVEGVRLLLSSARTSPQLEAMLEARDGLGGFTPLAVAMAWRNWAVTLPRSLAAAPPGGNIDQGLRMQAFDGVADTCPYALPAYDEKASGFSLVAAADALASCGFLAEVPRMLLEAGASVGARDFGGLTPLHHAHPALVPDPEQNGFEDIEPTSTLTAARRAVTNSLAKLGITEADALLAESRPHRLLWHRNDKWPTRSTNLTSLDADSTECDAPVFVVRHGQIDSAEVVRRVRDASEPVLVLDALEDASWDDARLNWNVEALRRSHGASLVRAGAIPYSSAFALEETVVDLKAALDAAAVESAEAAAMRKRAPFHAPPAPTYVFEQIRWDNPADHPLGKLVASNVGNLPALTDAQAKLHNAQFYVGDALSG